KSWRFSIVCSRASRPARSLAKSISLRLGTESWWTRGRGRIDRQHIASRSRHATRGPLGRFLGALDGDLRAAAAATGGGDVAEAPRAFRRLLGAVVPDRAAGASPPGRLSGSACAGSGRQASRRRPVFRLHSQAL